ncbi:MAG: phage major capsid protein [Pseudomonadota bacterium]|nr:phage major capsid protein [Pseudomonadota bacterium]
MSMRLETKSAEAETKTTSDLLRDLKAAQDAEIRTSEEFRSRFSSLNPSDVVTKSALDRSISDVAEKIRASAELRRALEVAEEAKTAAEEAARKAGRMGGGSPEAGDPNAAEHKTAFFNFLRHPTDPAAISALRDAEKKAVSTGTDAAGGFAVPSLIATEIEKKIVEVSEVRQFAKVVTVGSPEYRELVDIGGATGEWVGEGDTRNTTNTPGLHIAEPTFGTMAAKPEASEESLDDIFFNVESWVTDSATETFRVMEGAAFISGNGTKKPTGFLAGTPTDDADGARAAGVLQYVVTGADGDFNALNPADALAVLVHTMKAGYRSGAVWAMNSLTAAACRILKDADGRFLWSASLAEGSPDILLGHRIAYFEDMPDIGSDAFAIAFGNFKRGYLIADRVGLRITRDEVTKPGFVKFILRKRVGGCILNDEAIKLLKFGTA